MAIVCGTDPDRRDAVAAEVAAALARKMGLPLHLVQAESEQPAPLPAQEHLPARSARESPRGDVQLHMTPDTLSESLVQVAHRVGARLIVLDVPGDLTRAWCARVAAQVLRRTLVPLLLAREGVVFDAWARGVRPLVVALDADFTVASRRASSWIEKLATLGPSEVVAVHQYETLRAKTPCQSFAARPRVAETTVRASIERELRTYLDLPEGGLQLRTRLVPRRGRADEQLTASAIEEGADLIALGYDVGLRDDEFVSTLYELLRGTDCSLLAVPGHVAAV